MDSVSAILMGQANRGKPLMVFDWVKAARLIKEKNPQSARAGLSGDWEWTGGSIYKDGKPDKDGYTYLSSTWAEPEIDIDGEIIGCWIWQNKSPGWDAMTKWPTEALKILRSKRKGTKVSTKKKKD